jgi:hypothetical protein
MNCGAVLPDSPREHEPAIERVGSSRATVAGLDADRVRGTLDDIAQADLFSGHESREANPVRRLAGSRPVGIFVIHADLLLACMPASN